MHVEREEYGSHEAVVFVRGGRHVSRVTGP